ncbi:hypothetical protein [Marinimicrobium sp. C2-29]|uniref:hypothetical protein n=1 Tax=Marinimicrobium sp. C2-29 TaxID=3139825 RepID=UPI0031394438
MITLSGSASAALENARKKSQYEEFVRFLCSWPDGGVDFADARLLLLDALSIPDVEVARRWAKRLIHMGQTRRDVARFIASQSVEWKHLEDRSACDGEDVSDDDLYSMCEATLYWSGRIHCGFSEERTVKERYLANGRLVYLQFDIEALLSGYSAFRLDISNQQGAYAIEKLWLVGNKDEILWRWSDEESDLEGVADIQFVCSQEVGSGRIVGLSATGHDPQFRMRIDEGTLARLSEAGGYCKVVFRAIV